ncbi:MAG: UDP-4-amino-4,6-dideoxy-N-acetyl-beta-L-altrosamine transaminase [Campylobacteraceae bacterium]|nr:UDP-4-amino-4,6-dideoxy-N-acetyl-beta-L-altrosamine transaminase [Campylobacteraceae bacterium]
MIPYSCQKIEQDDIDAVTKALKSEFLTGGEMVERFEEALARYVGVKYACTLNSATSALHVAYSAIGLKDGDEIITTPITFAATSNAALMCGARVVFCDVKSNGNIDENKIEELITNKTKAIVPVDLGGIPVAIDKIRTICKKHKLFLIEDACHALGSELNDKKVGSNSDMSIFSFHAIKPITTCGEGGAILTNDKKLYEKAKLLRSHGIIKKKAWNSDMLTLGYNYRLGDVACALGVTQLKKLDNFINERVKIAQFYDEYFLDNPYFFTIKLLQQVKSSYHLYPILLDKSLWCSKEDIFEALHAKGIGVQVHYKPIYQFSYYKNLFGKQRLNGAEDFYKAELSLPCHQNMSLGDAKFVADALFDILEKHKRCGIIL